MNETKTNMKLEGAKLEKGMTVKKGRATHKIIKLEEQGPKTTSYRTMETWTSRHGEVLTTEQIAKFRNETNYEVL